MVNNKIGFNICPYLKLVFCMQMSCDSRAGDGGGGVCCAHPSCVARRIRGGICYGLLTRELLIGIEKEPCVELD